MSRSPDLGATTLFFLFFLSFIPFPNRKKDPIFSILAKAMYQEDFLFLFYRRRSMKSGGFFLKFYPRALGYTVSIELLKERA
jgi:hypothetical protein